jgi:poly(A) polymerase/tRNA nucleotidyltransferase (CCA-adding enzyme)
MASCVIIYKQQGIGKSLSSPWDWMTAERGKIMGPGSIRTAEWDIPPFVRSVITRLHRAGHEAYVVGGAVRDFCMARPATDWDVTTSASPEHIASVFKRLRSFSLKHETVTLVYRRRHYEVTTFRGPNKTLEEDLKHRDFTINAMAYDMGRSVLIDPWGGRKDIAKGVVRGVVSPEERFREDPLRLMRAVRIAAELGFRIHGKSLKAISSMAEAITAAAPERIRDELVRILLCEKPSQGLHLLKKTGLMARILPELVEAGSVRESLSKTMTVYQHILATGDQVEPDAVLRLASLFHGIAQSASPDHETRSAKAAQEIMVRLCFSKSMIRQVVRLVQEQEALAGYDSSWSDGDLRRFIRRVGVEDMESLISLRRADLLTSARRAHEPLRLLDEIQRRMRDVMKTPLVRGPQDLAINGSKVMELLDLSPGPEVGRILERLSEELMDHPKWNTRKRLMALLKEMKPAA